MSACLALGLLHGCLPKEREAFRKLARALREDKDNDVKDLAVKLLSKID